MIQNNMIQNIYENTTYSAMKRTKKIELIQNLRNNISLAQVKENIDTILGSLTKDIIIDLTKKLGKYEDEDLLLKRDLEDDDEDYEKDEDDKLEEEDKEEEYYEDDEDDKFEEEDKDKEEEYYEDDEDDKFEEEEVYYEDDEDDNFELEDKEAEYYEDDEDDNFELEELSNSKPEAKIIYKQPKEEKMDLGYEIEECHSEEYDFEELLVEKNVNSYEEYIDYMKGIYIPKKIIMGECIIDTFEDNKNLDIEKQKKKEFLIKKQDKYHFKDKPSDEDYNIEGV